MKQIITSQTCNVLRKYELSVFNNLKQEIGLLPAHQSGQINSTYTITFTEHREVGSNMISRQIKPNQQWMNVQVCVCKCMNVCQLSWETLPVRWTAILGHPGASGFSMSAVVSEAVSVVRVVLETHQLDLAGSPQGRYVPQLLEHAHQVHHDDGRQHRLQIQNTVLRPRPSLHNDLWPSNEVLMVSRIIYLWN